MKKNLKQLLILMTVFALALTLFTGCKKEAAEESSAIVIEAEESTVVKKEESSQAPQESSQATVQESSKEESSAPEKKDGLINDPNMNPLTGEILDHPVADKRPVCFTINNHPDAVPAVGISHADIIYEGIIEGGATRMLAVFQELPDDIVIGSIRSLRHNYIEFAACYDAIIGHCGCSERASDMLSQYDYDDIDAISYEGSLYYRDGWRDANMGYVHSLVTTGEAINDYLAEEPFRTKHNSDYKCNMSFSENPVVSGGELMTTVDVFFGEYRHTIFTFDAATNDYTAEEYDEPYIDYETSEPVRFKNLLVIKADVWEFDGVHQDMALTGEGEGYFCVNGVAAPIKWTRDSFLGQFTFTYADGTPVVFGVGTTYIGVVNLDGGIS